MVSILQCPTTPKEVFVAKYLFLEQNNQIWDEPLCSGHFFAVPMVSVIERFHCIRIEYGDLRSKHFSRNDGIKINFKI